MHISFTIFIYFSIKSYKYLNCFEILNCYHILFLYCFKYCNKKEAIFYDYSKDHLSRLSLKKQPWYFVVLDKLKIELPTEEFCLWTNFIILGFFLTYAITLISRLLPRIWLGKHKIFNPDKSVTKENLTQEAKNFQCIYADIFKIHFRTNAFISELFFKPQKAVCKWNAWINCEW